MARADSNARRSESSTQKTDLIIHSNEERDFQGADPETLQNKLGQKSDKSFKETNFDKEELSPSKVRVSFQETETGDRESNQPSRAQILENEELEINLPNKTQDFEEGNQYFDHSKESRPASIHSTEPNERENVERPHLKKDLQKSWDDNDESDSKRNEPIVPDTKSRNQFDKITRDSRELKPKERLFADLETSRSLDLNQRLKSERNEPNMDESFAHTKAPLNVMVEQPSYDDRKTLQGSQMMIQPNEPNYPTERDSGTREPLTSENIAKAQGLTGHENTVEDESKQVYESPAGANQLSPTQDQESIDPQIMSQRNQQPATEQENIAKHRDLTDKLRSVHKSEDNIQPQSISGTPTSSEKKEETELKPQYSSPRSMRDITEPELEKTQTNNESLLNTNNQLPKSQSLEKTDVMGSLFHDKQEPGSPQQPVSLEKVYNLSKRDKGKDLGHRKVSDKLKPDEKYVDLESTETKDAIEGDIEEKKLIESTDIKEQNNIPSHQGSKEESAASTEPENKKTIPLSEHIKLEFEKLDQNPEKNESEEKETISTDPTVAVDRKATSPFELQSIEREKEKVEIEKPKEVIEKEHECGALALEEPQKDYSAHKGMMKEKQLHETVEFTQSPIDSRVVEESDAIKITSERNSKQTITADDTKADLNQQSEQQHKIGNFDFPQNEKEGRESEERMKEIGEPHFEEKDSTAKESLSEEKVQNPLKLNTIEADKEKFIGGTKPEGGPQCREKKPDVTQSLENTGFDAQPGDIDKSDLNKIEIVGNKESEKPKEIDEDDNEKTLFGEASQPEEKGSTAQQLPINKADQDIIENIELKKNSEDVTIKIHLASDKSLDNKHIARVNPEGTDEKTSAIKHPKFEAEFEIKNSDEANKSTEFIGGVTVERKSSGEPEADGNDSTDEKPLPEKYDKHFFKSDELKEGENVGDKIAEETEHDDSNSQPELQQHISNRYPMLTAKEELGSEGLQMRSDQQLLTKKLEGQNVTKPPQIANEKEGNEEEGTKTNRQSGLSQEKKLIRVQPQSIFENTDEKNSESRMQMTENIENFKFSKESPQISRNEQSLSQQTQNKEQDEENGMNEKKSLSTDAIEVSGQTVRKGLPKESGMAIIKDSQELVSLRTGRADEGCQSESQQNESTQEQPTLENIKKESLDYQRTTPHPFEKQIQESESREGRGERQIKIDSIEKPLRTHTSIVKDHQEKPDQNEPIDKSTDPFYPNLERNVSAQNNLFRNQTPEDEKLEGGSPISHIHPQKRSDKPAHPNQSENLQSEQATETQIPHEYKSGVQPINKSTTCFEESEFKSNPSLKILAHDLSGKELLMTELQSHENAGDWLERTNGIENIDQNPSDDFPKRKEMTTIVAGKKVSPKKILSKENIREELSQPGEISTLNQESDKLEPENNEKEQQLPLSEKLIDRPLFQQDQPLSSGHLENKEFEAKNTSEDQKLGQLGKKNEETERKNQDAVEPNEEPQIIANKIIISQDIESERKNPVLQSEPEESDDRRQSDLASENQFRYPESPEKNSGISNRLIQRRKTKDESLNSEKRVEESAPEPKNNSRSNTINQTNLEVMPDKQQTVDLKPGRIDQQNSHPYQQAVSCNKVSDQAEPRAEILSKLEGKLEIPHELKQQQSIKEKGDGRGELNVSEEPDKHLHAFHASEEQTDILKVQKPQTSNENVESVSEEMKNLILAQSSRNRKPEDEESPGTRKSKEKAQSRKTDQDLNQAQQLSFSDHKNLGSNEKSEARPIIEEKHAFRDSIELNLLSSEHQATVYPSKVKDSDPNLQISNSKLSLDIDENTKKFSQSKRLAESEKEEKKESIAIEEKSVKKDPEIVPSFSTNKDLRKEFSEKVSELTPAQANEILSSNEPSPISVESERKNDFDQIKQEMHPSSRSHKGTDQEEPKQSRAQSLSTPAEVEQTGYLPSCYQEATSETQDNQNVLKFEEEKVRFSKAQSYIKDIEPQSLDSEKCYPGKEIQSLESESRPFTKEVQYVHDGARKLEVVAQEPPDKSTPTKQNASQRQISPGDFTGSASPHLKLGSAKSQPTLKDAASVSEKTLGQMKRSLSLIEDPYKPQRVGEYIQLSPLSAKEVKYLISPTQRQGTLPKQIDPYRQHPHGKDTFVPDQSFKKPPRMILERGDAYIIDQRSTASELRFERKQETADMAINFPTISQAELNQENSQAFQSKKRSILTQSQGPNQSSPKNLPLIETKAHSSPLDLEINFANKGNFPYEKSRADENLENKVLL